MKKFIFFLMVGVSVSVLAQTPENMPPAKVADVQATDNCEVLVEQAEGNNDRSVYERCSFDDPVRALQYWGPYVSSKNFRKALYELSVRHPANTYAELYLKKSADLGYGPAVMKMGHQAFDKGNDEEAVGFYKIALQSNQLNNEEQAEIAERMGLIYLDPRKADHDFVKAMTFIRKAADSRQALSNNILGYYAYTGENNFPKDDRVALNYFWRAVLLGCPAAQENVGVFHLARKGQIARPVAVDYMHERLSSCIPPAEKSGMTDQQKAEFEKFMKERSACDCDDVTEQAARLKKQPYILLNVEGNLAKIADSTDRAYLVEVGRELPDGTKVMEIRPTAIIVNKDNARLVLNLYPKKCADLCIKPDLAIEQTAVRIKPYHITFTDQECLDLLAYARDLVDTNQPFFGKKECSGLQGKQSDTTEIFSLLNNEFKAEPVGETPAVAQPTSASTPVTRPPVRRQPVATYDQIQAQKKAAIEQQLQLNRQLPPKQQAKPTRLNPLNPIDPNARRQVPARYE